MPQIYRYALMNRRELKKKLDSEGISENSYSLSGGLPSEKYALSSGILGRWAVYYSERGMRKNEKIFLSENDACLYFLDLLLQDPTTRK